MKNTTIFSGLDGIAVGAHRGASAYAPENTMAAFERGLACGAELIELDVQLTKDGEIVVFHDLTVDKTTNGRGPLRDYTLAELRALDAGSWFSADFAGERVPTLEDVLVWARDRIRLSIELKQPADRLDPALARRTARLVAEHGMNGQAQLMSFRHDLVKAVRDVNQDVLTAAISAHAIERPIALLEELGAQILNTPLQHLSAERVAELHGRGFYVYGSMSDDPAVFARLMAMGVDAMDTNVPDVMVGLRRNNRAAADAASTDAPR
ncbi:glycerophosphoryl diester phosphodiesterase [Paenibacillus sp. UNC496MF]|uniref:glycerophosphodiester phosphodiesterase n=1 Tax=Paenibacillus sp. UNC496MF TaxID=1502753 RepID=UPI0008ECE40E|nr:glycerophosphodiester phosphodiesterase family protein [Paenibacillus sp. UNC496MF]SFJ72331.1 glycerophosphoryl diester phosphodiesterase [Paenibacillus sp. UNC496MF]